MWFQKVHRNGGEILFPTALMRGMRGDREGRVIAECCMMSQFPSNKHSHIAPGHMLMAEARDHGGSTRNCTLQHFGFPHFRRRSQSHKLLQMSFWDNPPISQSSFEIWTLNFKTSRLCTAEGALTVRVLRYFGCFRESFCQKILHYLVKIFVNSLDISVIYRSVLNH